MKRVDRIEQCSGILLDIIPNISSIEHDDMIPSEATIQNIELMIKSISDAEVLRALYYLKSNLLTYIPMTRGSYDTLARRVALEYIIGVAGPQVYEPRIHILMTLLEAIRK